MSSISTSYFNVIKSQNQHQILKLYQQKPKTNYRTEPGGEKIRFDRDFTQVFADIFMAISERTRRPRIEFGGVDEEPRRDGRESPETWRRERARNGFGSYVVEENGNPSPPAHSLIGAQSFWVLSGLSMMVNQTNGTNNRL